jgi:hypothetical protein
MSGLATRFVLQQFWEHDLLAFRLFIHLRLSYINIYHLVLNGHVLGIAHNSYTFRSS